MQVANTLGELERAVMDAVWDAAEPVSAYDVQDLLEAAGRSLAATTLLTVFSRLEKKGFVSSDRACARTDTRQWLRVSTTSPSSCTKCWAARRDRTAVLARFVGSVSEADAVTLRQLLRAEDLRG